MCLQASARSPTPQPETVACRRWLVVEPLGPVGPTPPFAPADQVLHSRFELLDPGLVARFAPQLVLAPLITARWDILDLAAVLERVGFRGTLIAQSRPLPRADLVLGEIRALFPGVDLRLRFVPA